MSKKTFTENIIKMLAKNVNVQRVSKLSITYTDEFKRNFIEEYLSGKFPRQIFEDNGFDIDIIGLKRVEQSASRWKSLYDKDGIVGLEDTRKINSGRPLKRELTKDETITRQDAKIKLLEEQVKLLKKLDIAERRLVNQGKSLNSNEIFKLIFDTIQQNKFKNVTRYFCKFLCVSKSGYYSFLKSVEHRNGKEKTDLELKELILKAFNKRGYKKGARSIKMVLENEYNIVFSRKRIRRIMRKYNINCPIRKSNPYRKIAKATKEHRTVPNKLNRNFKQDVPGKVLLTDITYMPFGKNGMAYLSTIKDGSTNEILAYHLSNRITLDIALETINKLIRGKKKLLHMDAFIHSDQGSHYTSPKFQALLKKHNLGQSMSRRGNCWDNAPQESFFGHLKDDVDFKSCLSIEELESKIDNYMIYYNNYRYQWNLKKMTPKQFRNHLLSA